MKILDINSDLEKTLKSFSNRKIKIITAFASGTEDLIRDLLKQDNSVEIIVGTINSFSSPKFIESFENNDNEKLKLYVDFRYESSIHWKLYLVEPNITIIGSANFTKTGVCLKRDTMAIVENDSLYGEYLSKIETLRENPDVVDVENKNIFNDLFGIYCEKHKKMQKALSKATQYNEPEDWLNNDINQTLPLFIWDSNHTEETDQKAYDLIEKSDIEITREGINDFHTYECAENKSLYDEGDIVITASHKGSYIKFESFDRIIYDDGTCYIYSFKKKKYKYPFKLDRIKKELKNKIVKWYKEEVIEIHRDDLSSLLRQRAKTAKNTKNNGVRS